MDFLANLRRLFGIGSKPTERRNAEPQSEPVAAPAPVAIAEPPAAPAETASTLAEPATATAQATPEAAEPSDGWSAAEVTPDHEAVAIEPPLEVEVAPPQAVEAPAAVPGLVLTVDIEGEPAPRFEITKSGAVVGRGEENGVRLNDLSVSRRHARITYRQGAFWLTDLGSTSGTWVDGTRLNAPHRVETGQVIDVGVIRLRAVVSEAPPSTKPETVRRPESSRQSRSRRT